MHHSFVGLFLVGRYARLTTVDKNYEAEEVGIWSSRDLFHCSINLIDEPRLTLRQRGGAFIKRTTALPERDLSCH